MSEKSYVGRVIVSSLTAVQLVVCWDRLRLTSGNAAC